MGIGWMKIVVSLAILLALGGWSMVFSFSEKPVLFSAFFGGQKTGTKWSTKATDPVFWNCEMGEGNAQINFEGLKERRSE
jgi:hypothetical protein